MRTFLWVVLVLDQLFLLFIGGTHLSRYELSEFALREQFGGRSDVYSKLRRSLNKRLAKVRRLQQLELTIGFAVSAAFFSHLNRPVPGVFYALLSALLIVLLQRLISFQKLAHALFEKTLDLILKTVDNLGPLWWVLGVENHATRQPTSQAEFMEQLRRLPSTVLSPLERERLENLLLASTKTVADIMTPKKRVMLVSPSATLGPIILSDLQKTGHGYFPVSTPKGEVEGILRLSDVADIHQAKQSPQVHDFMSSQLSWVGSDQSLFDLATVFLSDKQYLLLVKNAEDEFIGVVTIADLMKHLLTIAKP